MNKLKCSMLVAATLLASTVYAGGPSVEPMPQSHNLPLFATLEGGYTWNDLGTTTVNSLTASESNKGFSGRVAAGAAHYSSYNPSLSYTGEFGWGYYGQTDYTLASRGVDAENYIYGLDLLGGVNYQVNDLFDVFFKLGGMLQNIRMHRNTNLDNFIGGTAVTGTDNETTTVSSVIPEIKLGGVYNFTDCWGISLAYMHAFGNNVSMTVDKTHTADTVTSTTTVTGAPVSLNNVMLGLRYRFG